MGGKEDSILNNQLWKSRCLSCSQQYNMTAIIPSGKLLYIVILWV